MILGIALFVCGDGSKVWPYALGAVIVGAALYFIDRQQKAGGRRQ